MASGNYDEPPFSNGTEYEIWKARYCERCWFWNQEYDTPCDEFFFPAICEDRTPLFFEPDGLSWTCKRFTPADG